jgi:hypothetical protein
MGIQGRGHSRTKSTAHIIELPVERGRLRPDKLPPEERKVWNQMVAAMPQNHFGPENEHLLRMLCSAVATSAVVGKQLATARDANDLEKVDTLSEIFARQSKVIADLSTKLKLTPRSRYSQEQASHLQRLAPQTRPWEPK